MIETVETIQKFGINIKILALHMFHLDENTIERPITIENRKGQTKKIQNKPNS